MEPRKLFLVPLGFAYRIFGGVANSFSNKFGLNDAILRSGLRISPQGYCSISFFIIFFIILPVSIIFSCIIFLCNLSLLLFIVPILLILISIIFLYVFPLIKSSMRSNGVWSELPIISTYFSILGLSHVPIYRGFEKLISQNIFPWFKFESELFFIDYMFFSRDPLVSIKNLISNHPCKDFRDYLDSYVRYVESGGYPADFLLDYSSKLSDRLSHEFKRFSEDANLFGDIIISLFVFLPLGLISMFIIMNPISSLSWLRLYGFILSPIITILIFVVVDSNQFKFPFNFGRYKRLFLTSFLSSILLTIICNIFSLNFPSLFTISVTSLLAPPCLLYEFDIRKAKLLELNLPKFVRDISESIKVGLSIEDAMAFMEKNSYGSTLNEIIRKINRSLSFSLTSVSEIFNEIISGINSWFAKATFWLIGEAISTGGGRAEVFSHLYKFCEDYYYFKHKVESELRIYTLIGYSSSIMLLFVVSQLIKFLNISFFDWSVPFNIAPNIISFDKELSSILVDTIYSVITFLSFLIGILVGKVSGGTIFSGFKHALICCYICILGIYGVSSLW